MLPDATLKERIRSECFGDRVFEEVAEPALVAETAGTTKTGRAPLSRNKRFAIVVALALIVCFVIGMSCYFALAKVPVAVSDTFVSININPSFGITADANDKVTSVTALNEDAAVVLYGMNLVGMSVSDAADRIVTESAKLGYLDTTSTGSMSFLAVNENGKKETAVANKLNLSLTALMAKNNWQTTVNSENADYANNGGSSSSYRFKFDFGRNSMSVVKSVDKAYASKGDVLTYKSTVTNNGTLQQTNLVFRDAVPAGTTFVTDSVLIDGVPKPGFNPTTGFPVEDLAPSGSVTVTFKAMVN